MQRATRAGKAVRPALFNAEVVIGGKIKEHRRARRYTLETLGQKTGLSRSFLSKLENGKTSPSVPTLLRIAQALGTSVSEILEGLSETSDEKLITIRSAERRAVARDGSNFGYSYEMLARKKGSAFEAFVVRFMPGRRPSEAFVHAGYEFNYVLKGQVQLVHGNQSLVLDVGDSAYYDSSVPHYGIARGSREAQVLAILIADET
jgi:transcriptional regulator with XRE-family HTH domain